MPTQRTIAPGEFTTDAIILTDSDRLVVQQGGGVTFDGADVDAVAIGWDNPTGGASSIEVDNAGLITSTGYGVSLAGTAIQGAGPWSLTLTNRAGAAMVAANSAIALDETVGAGSITIDNAGRIQTTTAEGQTFDLEDSLADLVIHNRATGEIIGTAGADVLRASAGAEIYNAGRIVSAEETSLDDSGGDAVDFQGNAGGLVHNMAGGLIEGARHGITGDHAVSVLNDEGASIIARNGAGLNIDSDASEPAMVVMNFGYIAGEVNATFYDEGDGDGVDIDGLARIGNLGTIEALGATGEKDGFINTADGIAMGGGRIDNFEGAVINSVGNGILVDDGSTGSAFGATRINNAGLIQSGEGFAIKLVGDFDDAVTNSGSIIGGNGVALELGDGDDLYKGKSGTVQGSINGEAGDDQLAGGKGAEHVIGGLGHDVLSGSGGADTLVGGAQGDQLTGGAGADTFVFGATTDSRSANLDTITDLKTVDLIDLSAIDANKHVDGDQAFTVVETFSGHRGELVLSYDAELGQTQLQADVNGDGQADMTVLIDGDHRNFDHFAL